MVMFEKNVLYTYVYVYKTLESSQTINCEENQVPSKLSLLSEPAAVLSSFQCLSI